MFNLINIGERAGSGIPNIFSVWSKQGWPASVIRESFDPERITVSLIIGHETQVIDTNTDNSKMETDNTPNASGNHRENRHPRRLKTAMQETAIVEFLTDHLRCKASQIADLLGVSPERARKLLAKMVEKDVIEPLGANRNRTYQLKD